MSYLLRFQAHPTTGLSLPTPSFDPPAAIVGEALTGLPKAALQTFVEVSEGQFDVAVRLEGRPSHTDALDEVVAVLGQVAYSTFKAEITELVGQAARMAVLGALGGGGLGARSKDPGIALIAAAVGGAAAAAAGSGMDRVKAVFLAERTQPFGEWRFTQVS